MKRLPTITCIGGVMLLLLALQGGLCGALGEAARQAGPGVYALNEASLAFTPFFSCLIFLAFCGGLALLERVRLAAMASPVLAFLICLLLLQGEVSVPAFKARLSVLLVWVPPFVFAHVLHMGRTFWRARMQARPELSGLYRTPPSPGGNTRA